MRASRDSRRVFALSLLHRSTAAAAALHPQEGYRIHKKIIREKT
jgi:hypothetical protein